MKQNQYNKVLQERWSLKSNCINMLGKSVKACILGLSYKIILITSILLTSIDIGASWFTIWSKITATVCQLPTIFLYS